MVRYALPLMVAVAGSALGERCTVLSEAPYITEAIVILTDLTTTVRTNGVVTLGVDFPEASGLHCVAKTTTITAAPTVCTVTALTTALTSYRCSEATTFTSCDACGDQCTSADLYCWSPSPSPKTTQLSGGGSGNGNGGGNGNATCVIGEATTVTAVITETATETSVVAKESTTVTVASVTETETETETEAVETVTVTSTVTAAAVTPRPITDTITSFVTVTGLGYNRTDTVSVTTQVNSSLTSTVSVTATANYNYTITRTLTDISTSTAAVTETITAPPSSASACSTIAPTLSCDKYGYLIQSRALVRIDLASGDHDEITSDVGSEGLVNALGYNVLDNYLYGRDSGTDSVLRISADGTSESAFKLTETGGGVVGDIDTEGSYWYATAGTTSWWQHDVLPSSPTYGTVLNKGTQADTGRTIVDWVYVPVTGRFLWTIGTRSPNGGSDLMKWSLDTFTWTIVANYPDVSTASFGAMYGINNGTIYASDNESGHIWSFDTSATVDPRIVSDGPASNSNDGARCVLNTSV